MAGDWIKVEKATPEKPEVLAISEMLELHPVHAFGLCVRFWMWCDDQLSDGNAKSVTKVTLDYVIGQIGMTDALIKVGWLRDRSGSLEVPHFDRHLSECSKNRALTKDRVRKSKEKGNGESVTKVTQGALPEKRREENIIKNTPPEFCPCSIEQAISQAPVCRMTAAQAEHWWNVRNASGWTKGSTGGGTPRRITSWQSDMATSAAWVAESMAKAQGAAKVARGRIVPDIGGRKPASIASWDDVKPLTAADLEEIEF